MSKSHFSRRQLLHHSTLGAMALALGRPRTGLPQAVPPVKTPSAKAVIQVFLWGGMSHTDTWDPKMHLSYDYTGSFRETIPTNIAGVELGALFPRLAQQADKFSLIRSMTHRNNGHETAAYLMQTGHPPGERLAYPCIGAVFALLKGYQAGYQGLIPPYVVLTQPQGRFSEAGFLGARCKPFATGGDPNANRFEVEGIIARGISDQRQHRRRELLQALNLLQHYLPEDPTLQAARAAEQQAYELILGEGREVFNLAHEEQELRNRYGRHTFGQSCLAARRLVEAGVPYITINYPGGWDTHSNHFATMNRQCPQLDQGLAALLQDLKERNLLKSTIVWCCGEFGRTPKVDWHPPWNGGRNHFGNVFSVLVAGGGFKGGRIVGASDEKGEEVSERPVYPIDLLGSIYQLAGIDPQIALPHPEGAQAHVLPLPDERGYKAAGLLTEIM